MAGEAKYPAVLMSPDISWHLDAKPGRLLRQDHDTHLLEQELAGGVRHVHV